MEMTFTEPGAMTGVGRHADAVRELPGDFSGIARVLHGLFIHEFWADQYGVKVADNATVNLRKTSDLLDSVLERRDAPLGEARQPEDRVPTNCRGFTTVAVALLRAHGVAARARCGFGMYFTSGWGEDHWVVEYRPAAPGAAARGTAAPGGGWKRGDAQLDDLQVKALGIGWDVAQLPEGEFRTGGEAWQRVRAGEDKEIKYGLSSIPEHGEFWISGNLMRDVAAVGGQESLPWDCWAPMPDPGDQIDYAYFDRMAAGEQKATVPAEVFNIQHDRVEPFS